MNAAELLASLPLGRIDRETISFYHSAPALSVSKIKVFRQSPALYCGRFLTGTIAPPEPTDALLFGSAAGALILEGREVFDAQYYVVPKGVGKQRVGDKAIRAELEAANPGKSDLSFNTSQSIERMNASIQEHRFAGPLIRACKPEITWRIKGELFHMQVRTDGFSDEGCELTQGEPFICDLKTIPALPDDEPETISKQIAEYWYHGQDYIYREIVSTVNRWPDSFRPRFFFIFVEKTEPYGVQVVELDDTSRDVAFKQVKDTMDRIKDCHLTSNWPKTWHDTWQKKVPTVSLPNFYIRRELEEERSLW